MKKRELPEVRNPYNYDSDKLSDDTGLRCDDPSLTKQEFVEEADINYIAEKYMRTGEVPTVLNLPTSGDFEGIFDYQTAMNTIAAAREEFMSLPAKTRSRFNNDPSELLAFVQDDDNYDEAVKLGFIPADKAKERRKERLEQDRIAQAVAETERRASKPPSSEEPPQASKTDKPDQKDRK